MKQINISTSRKKDEKGVAIITVLAVLMLMTVMVISFFTMATNELNASRSNAEGLRAQSAKDIAINLAIAQIRQATTREGTIWISQPGAIRLYGRNDRSGKARSIYKLYSSRAMVASTTEEIARDLARDWNNRPQQYVDLNRPVIKPDPADPESISRASIHFPIVDPRAFSGRGREGSVEGFSIESNGVSGVVSSGSDHLKRLPMPVQWLYVLADGSVGYLDNGNRFVGQIKPTDDNPITSRIAFWTDDETSKINVNTASEGVYWDTPRVDTREDRDYAKFQPQTNEFQRYPGHPAQTSLSTVLFPGEGRGEFKRLDPKKDRDKLEAIWTIAPGIGIGGSRGGTVTLDDIDAEGIDPTPLEYHLYASPEEILFQSNLMSGQRLVHPQITPQKLESAKFFLTARSRAPEVTLLGQPRMSMWPVPTNVGNRTAFDKVIAFCSTINRGQYFFQRNSAYSRHNEFYGNAGGRNNILYEYYRNLTNKPFPGFGTSFAKKYGSGQFDDRDNIVAEIIDYFRCTNLYDGTNRWTYTNGGKRDDTMGHGQIAANCLCGGTGPHTQRWHNSRLPLPKGFGRIIGISEVALMLVLRARKSLPDVETGEVQAWGEETDTSQLEDGQKMIQLALIVEGFAPAHGWTSLQPQNTLSIGGGTGNRNDDLPESFTLNGERLRRGRGRSQPQRTPRHLDNYPGFVETLDRNSNPKLPKRAKDWISWGGYGGVRMFENLFTFEPVIIDGGLQTVRFGGSSARRPARIILYDTQTSGFDVNNLIQSYQLAFPAAEMPVPSWWNPNGSSKRWHSIQDRIVDAINNGVEGNLYSPANDTVWSLVPSHGDYRITTNKRVVDPESFVPHPDYGGSKRMAHSLTDYTSPKTGVEALPGATFHGDFLEGIDYPAHRRPDFPIGPSERDLWAQDVDPRDGRAREPYEPSITGDWDTGVGNASDGPYINRPDDGDVRGLDKSGEPYFDYNREDRESASATFAPNRVIPSAGMLGSLSTGVQSNVPWQTLLFRPMDEKKHYGASSPPDHLWMDMFWMPIVQPYVISEPFSTAGKINMNFQILPFTYIRRATGMHAIMKNEKFLAIPKGAANKYKDDAGNQQWRHYISVEETLKQWDEKFDEGEAFRSATEICDMYLVPEGERWTDAKRMEKFWDDHKLTGDNVKERPYTNMYPRLTVRSNTFKVHMVAQSIVKVKGTEPDTFDPVRDRVAGEWRGSAIVERSISPNDDDLPDYARDSNRGNESPSLDLFYTYRVVNLKRFAP